MNNIVCPCCKAKISFKPVVKEAFLDVDFLEKWLRENLVERKNSFLMANSLFDSLPEQLKTVPELKLRTNIYKLIEKLFREKKIRNFKKPSYNRYGFTNLALLEK